MLPLSALAAVVGLLASANVVAAQDSSAPPKNIKFLIAGNGFVSAARQLSVGALGLDFSIHKDDKTFNPQWVVQSKIGYLFSDSNTGVVMDTVYNKESNNLTMKNVLEGGSTGVSHMTYNKQKTSLLASTGSGVDIWDSSSADGSLKFNNAMRAASAEIFFSQVVPDPSGKIYVVNDRGTNRLTVLKALDDRNITELGSIPIGGECGPRRGAFYAVNGQDPTRYFVLCQSTKQLISYEVDLAGGVFAPQQVLQTFVDTESDMNSVADLILHMNSDRSADIYVTNTFVSKSGGTDTISHFRLPAPKDDASAVPDNLTGITADRIVSSHGINPNSICLDGEGQYLIVGILVAPALLFSFWAVSVAEDTNAVFRYHAKRL